MSELATRRGAAATPRVRRGATAAPPRRRGPAHPPPIVLALLVVGVGAMGVFAFSGGALRALTGAVAVIAPLIAHWMLHLSTVATMIDQRAPTRRHQPRDACTRPARVVVAIGTRRD